MLHAGVRETLTQLRDRFWILRPRQAVKKSINRCLICKRFSVKAASEPYAPLPKDRVAPSDPFSVVVIDFAGPLFHRSSAGAEKVYIVVFTCAVTRAVHLELTCSLTTPDFLAAFGRFTARRGICKTIYSDNGRTFKHASKDLKLI